MGKHTPGPWTAVNETIVRAEHVVDAEGRPMVVYHSTASANAHSIAKNGIRAHATTAGNLPEVWVSDTPAFSAGSAVYAIDARGLDLEESFGGDVPNGERWFAVYSDIRPEKMAMVKELLTQAMDRAATFEAEHQKNS